MIIALDAFGGDNAPHEIVKGGLEASKEFGIEILFVGNEDLIKQEISSYQLTGKERFSIFNAESVITMHDHPGIALKTKKDSSLYKAIELVKEKKADAIVSAGNTGAQMAISLFVLGRIKNILRPAIGVSLPTKKGYSLLIDGGAVADWVPENLFQFAKMGVVFVKNVWGINNPKVALLNIGEEKEKGSKEILKTHAILKSKVKEFTGNIEPKDVLKGDIDVIVTDGFTGNVVLKTVEGTAETIMSYLKEAIKSNVLSKAGGLLIQSSLKKLKAKLDYSETGGAPLLGVNGISIIAHGRSDRKAIKNAIKVAKTMVDASIIDKILNF